MRINNKNKFEERKAGHETVTIKQKITYKDHHTPLRKFSNILQLRHRSMSRL